MKLIINKKKIFFLSILFLLLVNGILLAYVAQADGPFDDQKASGYLSELAGKVNLEKNKGGTAAMIGYIINGVLGFLGIIFLILIIYAGLKWMMAGGAEEDVNEARQLIKWAIIGVIVILGAYALSYFVINSISEPLFRQPVRPDLTYEKSCSESPSVICTEDSDCPNGEQCIDMFYEEDEILPHDCTYVICNEKSESGCNDYQDCCVWKGMADPTGRFKGEPPMECLKK